MASARTDMEMDQDLKPLYSDKKTRNPAGETWLSGGKLIQQTGVSKRDLIRFIQLGALPKSMMRLSPAGRTGAPKRSYFSRSILERVGMLKHLREEGHSVEAIAAELREAGEGAPFPRDQAWPKTPPPAPFAEEVPEGYIPPRVHLRIEGTTGAAFFVNHDLRIAWIRTDREDRLSRTISNELADDPSGTVFDIMLRASLKELVFNWQPLFSFTYRFLQETTSPGPFNRLAPTISLNPERTDHPEKSGSDAVKSGPIDSCPIRLEDDEGRIRNMRMYGIALLEGTLFILNEEREQDAGHTTGQSDAASGKIPFGVLSARLDDSRNIVDTLLPETYFQLMTRIWDQIDRVLASNGGHRAKRSGTEVQYIIPRQADTDPAYNAIHCAVELRDKMRELRKSLKAEGVWYADIRLNIGISSGKDYLKQDDPTASMSFMLPGGAADQAFHLSAIAHGGGIWITKSAFSHLSPHQIKRITFGIYRDNRLIPSIFAQVSDLPHPPDTPPLGRGIRSLFITRIISLQPSKRSQRLETINR